MLRDLKNDAAAAAKYRPDPARVVLVAEAPPCVAERYFYFAGASEGDTLWLETMKAAFGDALPKDAKQVRADKARWLRRFADGGGLMFDLVREGFPEDWTDKRRVMQIRASAADAVSRIRALDPELVVLVKKTVWEGFADAARAAGLPVLQTVAVPFPGSGNQAKFQSAMRDLGFARFFA